MKFSILGTIPAKKNAWTRRQGVGMYLSTKITAELEAIIWQVKAQSKGESFGYQPVSVSVRFFQDKTEIEVLPCPDPQFRPQRRDMDNMLTSILDALQKAGVISNDRSVVKIEAVTLANTTP